MQTMTSLRNYLTITFAYWGFTITDGAIRMLVILYFHQLGYAPLEIALLFIFYEFFGIVTNLIGGWIASRLGLNITLHLGMLLQIIALCLLTVPDTWLSIVYVMFAQALSGIAKDLNKMSAKASVKLMLPQHEIAADAKLFKWVAILTGSKNALKGAGFFIGAGLLAWIGFRETLFTLAGGLSLVLILTFILLPQNIGKAKTKAKFTQILSKSADINWLSAARFFLFGSRDIWFVVALPVFLSTTLQWQHYQVGAFIALWIIAYGLVQSFAPRLLKNKVPNGATSRFWIFLLAFFPAGIALSLSQNFDPTLSIIIGLTLFGIVFAINSAIHSYLILAYSSHEKVTLNVGFYYMANAGGRLTGTILSGWIYQTWGLTACLWFSSIFLLIAALLSLALPKK